MYAGPVSDLLYISIGHMTWNLCTRHLTSLSLNFPNCKMDIMMPISWGSCEDYLRECMKILLNHKSYSDKGVESTQISAKRTKVEMMKDLII